MKRPAETYAHTLDESEKRKLEEIKEEMTARYGAEIAGLIVAKFTRSILKLGGCDFMDTIRVCDADDPADVEQYREIQRWGCCGNFDGKLHIRRLGRTFWYGMNWGH